MKILDAALIASLVLSSSASLAARSPHMKDEVAKIAVGPKADTDSETEAADATEKATETATATTDTPDVANEADPTDAVDKPLKKPSVITTDAPQTKVMSEGAEAPIAVSKSPAKATAPKIQADEDDNETGEKAGAPAHEIGTPKAQVLKIENAASATVHEEKSPTPPKPKPAHIVDGVSAQQSLKWLENGNARYITKKYRSDGRSEKERAKTARGQKPHAIILSCSDSRVPPEMIFDQGLGEITTIRVAGEVLDLSVIASLEQAVLNEHPHLLVVLGHTQCESIEATLGWKEKTTDGSDALDRLVSEIKPHLKTLSSGVASPGLQIEAALQADGVARDLTERSEIIKKAVASGELTIKTGLYWVDTGKVKFY